jgi:hypothetical protein
MAQEIINIGALPNDGEGDPLRTAFNKINNNFTQIFSTGFDTTTGYTSGLDVDQVIFETPVSDFTQATFQVNSINPLNQDSLNITISAGLKNNGTDVKFTGHSILIQGNAVSNYNMDVSGGNVRLLSSPIVNADLAHFIAYQVTYSGNVATVFQLNGYGNGNVMSAQNNDVLALG